MAGFTIRRTHQPNFFFFSNPYCTKYQKQVVVLLDPDLNTNLVTCSAPDWVTFHQWSVKSDNVLPPRRHLLLWEEVSVGAAVLHGDAVAFAAHAVSRHSDGAVVVRQGGVLQHRHVPQKGVGTLLSLQTHRRAKQDSPVTSCWQVCVSMATLDLLETSQWSLIFVSCQSKPGLVRGGRMWG